MSTLRGLCRWQIVQAWATGTGQSGGAGLRALLCDQPRPRHWGHGAPSVQGGFVCAGQPVTVRRWPLLPLLWPVRKDAYNLLQQAQWGGSAFFERLGGWGVYRDEPSC